MRLSPDADAARTWRATCEELRVLERSQRASRLFDISAELRRTVLRTISAAGLGHPGGDLSIVDVLTCLYFGLVRVDPEHPDWPARDRVILSKGHASVSFYTTLSRCGFFPATALEQFARPLSPLGGHADRTKVPGVEASTGPLGHGLPIAVGAALAAQAQPSAFRVYVILGDGELQEGSNWEAAMYASQRGLWNLLAVVDRNGLQQGARTEDTNRLEPLASKWASFGWEVEEVDGHDHADLLRALGRPGTDRPRCVIAHTVKGKGVSFMEGQAVWHHRVPSAEELERALAELGG